MAFKFPKREPEPDHIRQEIKDRIALGTPITWEEWQEMRVNSYEQEACYPHMTDDCLSRVIQHSLNNCSPKRYGSGPATTYDEAVIHVFTPLLLKRLEEVTYVLENVASEEAMQIVNLVRATFRRNPICPSK